MNTDKNSGSLHPILDDIAVDALIKPIEQVEAELVEAGVDVRSGVTRFRGIAASVVTNYRQQQQRDLPESIPEDTDSAIRILDQLLAMPQARESNMVMAFRDLDELTDSDKRQLAISLLELLKDNQ